MIYIFLLSLLVLVGAAVSIETCESDDIIQLCGDLIDPACVRDYFKKHAKCRVVKNPKSNVTVQENLPIFMSKVDTTAFSRNTTLSRLDEGDIQQFYMNKKNGKIVITVDFTSKGMYCDAPGSYFAIAQDGEEPKVVKEHVNTTYPVRLMAEIPLCGKITAELMKKAEFSAYFPYPNIPIYIGPQFTQSKDHSIKTASEGLCADLPTGFQEIFGTKASFIFMTYFQNNICDFGVDEVLYDYDITVFNRLLDVDKNEESQSCVPCAHSEDVTNCVRSYIANKGCCSIVDQPKEEPFYVEKLGARIPVVNSTLLFTKSYISGLNGQVTKFYVNEQTNNLVISVAFNSIVLDCPLVYLDVHQMDRETKTFADYCTHTYPVTLTAVIPMYEGITAEGLKQSYVSAYFREQPILEFGPSITESKDPQMQTIKRYIESESTTIGKELFATAGPKFFLMYLQNYMCNFWVPVSN